MSFVFTVFDDGIAMFDSIAEKIDDTFSVHPSVSIHIYGDFNIHHKEWLDHSTIQTELTKNGNTISP